MQLAGTGAMFSFFSPQTYINAIEISTVTIQNSKGEYEADNVIFRDVYTENGRLQCTQFTNVDSDVVITYTYLPSCVQEIIMHF